MSVYTKLNAARKEFHTLKLTKTGHNKFAGYNYFELGDFLIPALNTFDKHGLCAFISFGKDIATMTITDVEDGTSVALTSPMAEANLKGCHPIQNLGAVETYTRRYLWVAALEIVEHDAIDSTEPLKEEQKKKIVIPATPRTEDLDLTEEDIAFLNDFAPEITEIVREQGGEAGRAAIQAAGLNNEQRIGLSNMLDSKTRSALKKAKEQSKAMDILTTD